MFKKIALSALCASALIIIGLRYMTTQDKNALILGTMSGWPPFVRIGTDGSYQGFDIDIAKIIAKKLGKTLVIKDMDTALLISALDQGQVDFIMTGLDITPERVKRISMIPYQGEPVTAYPLIFYKTIPEGIETLKDLQKIPNAIICVESGSSQEEVLRNYEGFEIKNVDPLVSLLELKTGRATASLLDAKMFKSLQKKEPNLVAKMVPLRADEVIVGCGIGIKKGNTALEAQIEAVIDDLKQSGALKDLESRWIDGTQEGAS